MVIEETCGSAYHWGGDIPWQTKKNKQGRIASEPEAQLRAVQLTERLGRTLDSEFVEALGKLRVEAVEILFRPLIARRAI